jgi:hypothetical protein
MRASPWSAFNPMLLNEEGVLASWRGKNVSMMMNDLSRHTTVAQFQYVLVVVLK